MNTTDSYNPTLQQTNPYDKSEMAQNIVQLSDQLYFEDPPFMGLNQEWFV